MKASKSGCICTLYPFHKVNLVGWLIGLVWLVGSFYSPLSKHHNYSYLAVDRRTIPGGGHLETCRVCRWSLVDANRLCKSCTYSNLQDQVGPNHIIIIIIYLPKQYITNTRQYTPRWARDSKSKYILWSVDLLPHIWGTRT